ncbi:hypothetical protein ACFPRL_08720 [Pseudoclavibacter helvolus]
MGNATRKPPSASSSPRPNTTAAAASSTPITTSPMARLVGLSRLSIRLVATRYAVAALVGTAICWEI